MIRYSPNRRPHSWRWAAIASRGFVSALVPCFIYASGVYWPAIAGDRNGQLWMDDLLMHGHINGIGLWAVMLGAHACKCNHAKCVTYVLVPGLPLCFDIRCWTSNTCTPRVYIYIYKHVCVNLFHAILAHKCKPEENIHSLFSWKLSYHQTPWQYCFPAKSQYHLIDTTSSAFLSTQSAHVLGHRRLSVWPVRGTIKR